MALAAQGACSAPVAQEHLAAAALRPSGLTASRTSGTAPLAVLVDATGLGPFDAVYDFDFGDERGQAWGPSGQPKNRQRGAALAAHVYEVPGKYTVRVGAASLTINVDDPAKTFAGKATVCVSALADFDGCPAGAARQSSLPGSYAGKRVLLRRGERFGAIAPRVTDNGFQVGAFGTGPKPVVAGVNTGAQKGVESWTSDWTVMDLDVGSVNVDASTARLLLLRNDIKVPRAEAMVNIGTAAGYYQAHGHPAMQWPREVFLVENDIQGEVVPPGSVPGITVMGWFLRSALLGNHINRANEHSVRMWAAHKTVIAHNAIGGEHFAPGISTGIRHAIKIHSSGLGSFSDAVSASPQPASSQVVIANNRIGSPAFQGSWLVGIGPQNADAGTVEGLEDFVAENNVFVRGPRTTSEIQWRGRRMVARGNAREGGKAAEIVRNGSRYDGRLSAWDGPYSHQ